MIPRTIAAREIMTREVRTCGPDEPLRAAAQLMRQHDCGCVPVVDRDERLGGILSLTASGARPALRTGEP